jgi:transcriptional regulator with XRE-family HTH domain
MELRGDKVKLMRLSNNWTQQQLAEICDINLRTIQRVEKQGNASLETIMALCVAFNVRREALFEVPKPEELDTKEPKLSKTHFMFFGFGLLTGVMGAFIAVLLT